MNSDFSLALHALVLLHRRGGVQSSEAMAQNICTNPVRVRRVLAKLKKAGWVQTREGSEGGYRLVADPDTLTLAGRGRRAGSALCGHALAQRPRQPALYDRLRHGRGDGRAAGRP